MSATQDHVGGGHRDAAQAQGAGGGQRVDARPRQGVAGVHVGEAESATVKTWATSSLVVTVASVPAGASLTGVTSTRSASARHRRRSDWSRTEKVKVV